MTRTLMAAVAALLTAGPLQAARADATGATRAIAAADADPMSRGAAYVNVGLPGVMVGYALPLNDSVTLRADYATLGSHSRDKTYDGIDFHARGKVNRFGLFADWFPTRMGLRLTGGVTFNDMKADLHFQGNGKTVTIGGRTVPTDPADAFDARVSFPGTTPYIGIGWGHQAGPTGLGFVADIGVSIGRAKVSGQINDSLKAKGVTQADVDQQLDKIRDDVAKISVIPQASVGVSYRF